MPRPVDSGGGMFLSAIAGWLQSRSALSAVVINAVAEYWTSLILIGLSVLLLVTGIF